MLKLGPYELDQIYTGDARELAKAIPDESVDLVLTDPPFGIGFKYGGEYKDDPEVYLDLVRWIVVESNRIIKSGGLCFVFVAQSRLRHIWPFLFPDNSRIFAACKNFVQMQGDLPFAYDPVVFWRKSGKALVKGKGRDYHVGNTANTGNRGMAEAGWHPCPRPLNTIIYMIENFCPEGGIVCDFFVGSGTTAAAAKITQRKSVAFEIDPNMAERARQRVENTQSPLLIPEPEQTELEGTLC